MSLRLQQGMAVMPLGARRSPWQPTYMPPLQPVNPLLETGVWMLKKKNYSDVGVEKGNKESRIRKSTWQCPANPPEPATDLDMF